VRLFSELIGEANREVHRPLVHNLITLNSENKSLEPVPKLNSVHDDLGGSRILQIPIARRIDG